MDSITIYTAEIDDLQAAAEELFSQLEGFKFKKHTLGVLHIEEDTEYPELYRVLSERFDFPIVGCTALGMFLGKQGYCNMGIGLMLLTADDCEFSVGITGKLDRDNYRDEIFKTYGAAREKLPSPPKLVISFGGTVTDERSVSGDDVIAAIDEAGGGVPIFGGNASDGYNFTGYRVFCNDSVIREGQVMALVSGNIRPKFVMSNAAGNRANVSYEVTEAKSNQVMRLGDDTFLATLRRENMAVDKTEVLGDYLISPFLLTLSRESGDSVKVARNLALLNQETGAGSFLGSVPEGSILSIGIIDRSDVQNSVKETFDTMFDAIEEAKGEYHTLLCGSCIARFMALAGNASEEAAAFVGRLPSDISLLGFYTYGEYCPVKGNKTGREYNLFHNFTFTLMAI